MLVKPATIEALPNVPLPMRRSTELGCALPTPRRYGSTWVFGSMKCATRVLTRPPSMPLNQYINSLIQLFPPSPMAIQFTGVVPVDMPVDAYVATCPQFTAATSDASRGYHASVSADIVLAIRAMSWLVYVGPLAQDGSVVKVLARASVRARCSRVTAASRT